MTFASRRLLALLTLLTILAVTAACTRMDAPTEPEAAPKKAAASAPAESESLEESIQNEMINLNDMTREQLLETIPAMGNRMVREFFEYQPYVSIQQFRREIGKYVDDEQVAFYEQYVFVPVDVNESDAETLKQIPALDESIADTLMANRPFDSNDAFLAALAEHLSAQQIEVAAAYLKE